jgi:hypothetical protein
MKLKTAVIIFAYLLCSLILISSCGDEPANNSGIDRGVENPANNEPANNDQGEANAAETMPDFPHEARTFGGRTFTILAEEEPSNFLRITDFEMEEEPGDVLGTAIYRRNQITEEKLGITLASVQTPRDSVRRMITRAVNAGTNDYDAVALRLENAAPAAMAGEAVNLNNLQYMSLDMPWWDQNILNDTSIGGQSYLIAGDIFTKHYDAIAMIFFNKKLLADFGLECPYNLVHENQWTLDNFGRLTKNITRDINGDGIIDHTDMFGFSTQKDFLTSMINGSGSKIFEKDGNDLPYFTGASEKISDIINKILDFYVNDTFCLHRDALAHNIDFDRMHQFMVFPYGRSLFLWGLPRYIELELRTMDDDFGMLPIPKFDSNQDRYYATANTWHSYAWLIPQGSGDPEDTAYIMDTLAYYGRIHILPAYYDVSLQRKHTRDEESSAMLDIIFNSAVYDIGAMYNLGEYVRNLENMIERNMNNTASEFERAQGRIERDLERLIEQFERNAH